MCGLVLIFVLSRIGMGRRPGTNPCSGFRTQIRKCFCLQVRVHLLLLTFLTFPSQSNFPGPARQVGGDVQLHWVYWEACNLPSKRSPAFTRKVDDCRTRMWFMGYHLQCGYSNKSCVQYLSHIRHLSRSVGRTWLPVGSITICERVVADISLPCAEALFPRFNSRLCTLTEPMSKRPFTHQPMLTGPSVPTSMCSPTEMLVSHLHSQFCQTWSRKATEVSSFTA